MPDILQVADLTRKMRALLEAEFPDVWVEGELSNFTRAASGHCYFSLKDEDAQIRCVMWRHLTKYVFFEPEDGMQVRVNGYASIYERRGTLQLQVQAMRRAGKGAQQREYERLKKQLKAEGLFDADRKQPLPTFPEVIGIVTSGQGAALHDIRSAIQRRFPSARLVLRPVPVQGVDAPGAIAEAIQTFNAVPPTHPQCPDVLIVGRGGGSAEDLWAFNDEQVARAAAVSTLPIVSAVGHESDVCILDFVADRRAATPSMAAEVVTPNGSEIADRIRATYQRLRTLMERRVADARQRVDWLTASRGFHRPADRVEQSRQAVKQLQRDVQRAASQSVHNARQQARDLQHRLAAADPEQPLRRGYAIVSQNSTRVASAHDLTDGDAIRMRFHDGTRSGVVTDDDHAVDDAS